MSHCIESNRGGVRSGEEVPPSEETYKPTKAQSLDELLSSCPKNQTIGDNLVRAWHIINDPKYKKIVCSISGGSDSDIMLDICWRCDRESKIDYVWFDTGLEYQATKDHLKFLESRYGIEIKPYKAIKPIPISCKTYGQPFISKRVSDYLGRLQQHGFQWEDEPFEILSKKYPDCKVALKWWCNDWYTDKLSETNPFNIARNKWLKEFIISNPPNFKISDKCCEYSKKKVLHKLIKESDYDLNCFGVRKAEGGRRSTTYKSCFDEKSNGIDEYRPLFWYKDSDKVDYEHAFHIVHSECYRTYGLTRTGCAGCCYNRNFEDELEIIKQYEPKLYVAVNNIFGDSYEYTRKYRQFCQAKNEENKHKTKLLL